MTTDSDKSACPHCDGEIDCPPEADNASIECPHCRQNVAMQSRRASKRPWLLLIILLAVVSAAGGWGGWLAWSRKSVTPSKSGSSILPNPLPVDLQRTNQLAFWDFSIQRNEGSTITHAVARVLNESDSLRYGVEVRLELLDALGRPLGTCRDYIERLEPNQDTHVRALVIKRDAAKARLLGISEQ